MPPLTPPVADLSLGLAYNPYQCRPFGLLDADRQFHVYVIGQSGTGKSTLLGNIAWQDARLRRGFCLIDPHGDLAASLAGIPNVTFWDVADPSCGLGYNPLTYVSPHLRPLGADGLISALKKQWSDAWGPRMEHLLRQALLTLLEVPGSTLEDIMRLFLNRSFQEEVLRRICDPQLRQFWQQEYRAMNYKSAADGVAPVANKLGALLAHPVVRRSLCAPRNPIRFRQIMDQGQSLVVNLGKGTLGAQTSNVLGGILIASLVNAAFSRGDLAAKDRVPFALMVDEFHHFTTGIFADALAECRKYGLGVILAQQHTAQTDPSVLAAILGNIGSLIAFRVGPLDAPIIARQLTGIDEGQLILQPNHRAMVQLMVEGEKTKPFSAEFPPPMAGGGA